MSRKVPYTANLITRALRYSGLGVAELWNPVRAQDEYGTRNGSSSQHTSERALEASSLKVVKGANEEEA